MKLRNRVSMFLVALTVCGGLFVSPAKAVKATNYAEEIAALQPGTTPEEIMKSANQIAKQQHVKQDVILKQFYKEITADKAEGDRLAKESGMSIMGGSSGTKTPGKRERQYLLHELLHSLLQSWPRRHVLIR